MMNESEQMPLADRLGSDPAFVNRDIVPAYQFYRDRQEWAAGLMVAAAGFGAMVGGLIILMGEGCCSRLLPVWPVLVTYLGVVVILIGSGLVGLVERRWRKERKAGLKGDPYNEDDD